MQQIDDNSWDCGVLKEVVSLRSDPQVAVQKGAGATKTFINGLTKPVITTKGWDFQVLWEDGSTSWLPLASIKESNPVEVAEFAIANGYANEPAFKWWVNHVIKKTSRIIGKMKSRCRKDT